MDNIDNAYPLTPAQLGMLFHVLDSPESNVYMAYVVVSLRGSIDIPRLRSSWKAVFHKYEALRAGFVWDGLEEPLQVIHASIDLPWQVDCLEDGVKAPGSQEILAICVEELFKPVDISNPPLSRVRLVQTGETQWKMIWTVHHLLVDGWCTPIIMSDLVSHYSSAAESLSEDRGVEDANEAFSFSEHVAWLANQDHVAAMTHWREYLSGVTCTPMRIEPQRRTITQVEAERNPLARLAPESTISLSAEETLELGQFCRHNKITLSTLLHLSWALLLSDYCDTDKPLFGTTSSGRQSGLSGIEGAVGLFLNMLPVCVDLSGTSTIMELLQDLQKNLHSNNQFDYAPLTEIQKMVSRDRNEALFDSIVVMESHSKNAQFSDPKADIHISDFDYKTHSNFALALTVFPGTELILRLLSDSQKFDFSYIEYMLPRFVSIINAIKSSSNATASEILTSSVLNQNQLQLSKGTVLAVTAHCKVHRWFEQTCDINPSKPAVVSPDTCLTFEQLDQQANQIARSIVACVKSQDTLIGIVLPRGCELVAAFLGVLKSGLAYVPLDPDFPDSRLSQILHSADINWVISSQQWQTRLITCGVNVLTIEQCSEQSRLRLPDPSSESSTRQADEQDLAYVMFTSGSTGLPKGVMVTHGNLIHSTTARILHYSQPDPVFLLLSAMTFDSSVAGLYWSLCGGGTVVLPRATEEKDLDIVGSLISQHSVTHTLCLPSLYRLVLQFVDSSRLATLQCVIVAGEQCMQNVIEEHQDQLPECGLFNEYGPTEATVWSTMAQLIPGQGAQVPIGHPIGNSLILLLSPLGRLCPPGVIGEIHIGGRGVAAGYYQDEEQTAERFIKNPINPADYPRLFRTGDLGYRNGNGELVFVGRVDRQLKIRGNRIEPAEVESVLIDYPGVNDVAVIGQNLTQQSGSDSSEIPGIEQLTNALHTFSAHEIDYLIKEAELSPEGVSESAKAAE